MTIFFVIILFSSILPFLDGNEEDDSLLTRIIGGSLASIGEFPAQISLQTINGNHFCGGTLINEDHLLTAAHCVTDRKTNSVFDPSVFLLMGNSLTTRQYKRNTDYQIRLATHVFAHPRYDYESLLNDIAVIRVSPPFVFTSTFHNLSRIESTPPVNYSCSIAGWGRTTAKKGPHSIQLQRVNVTIMDNARCNHLYGGQIDKKMICAGAYEGGKDSCQGDSGGAMYCGKYVAGVVSFGRVCGDANYPGVYTNVAFYNYWINSVILWKGSNSNIPTPATTNSITTSGMVTSIHSRGSFDVICSDVLVIDRPSIQ